MEAYVSAPIQISDEKGGTYSVYSLELQPNKLYTFHGIGNDITGGMISTTAVWVVGESIGGTGTAMASADSELDVNSINPIQNQAVANKFEEIEKKIQESGKVVFTDGVPSQWTPNVLYVIEN